MNKFKATAAIAGSLTMVALAAAPTFAASGPPYDVEVAGQNAVDTAFSAEAGAISFTIPLVSMGCTSTTGDGTILAGDTSPGGHIADITGTTWNGCTGPLGLPMSVTQDVTWEVHGTSPATDNQTDQIDGYVGNVKATVRQVPNASACTFVVEGQASGYFDENTQELVVNQQQANSTLRVTDFTGCYGLVRLNDPASFDGTFKVGTEADYTVDLPVNVKEL